MESNEINVAKYMKVPKCPAPFFAKVEAFNYFKGENNL